MPATLNSWLDIPADSDFSLHNIPFGVHRAADGFAHAATAIGDTLVDLHVLHDLGFFDQIDVPPHTFARATLNPFIALGRPTWRTIRQRIQQLFSADNTLLRDNAEARAAALHPRSEARMLMPVFVRDYTDFYSSVEHATNVGSMFRDPENALLPNWKHLPVGYHGRASSIVVSGEPIHRPKGQTKPADDQPPQFGPSRLLDFELEMAFVVGKPTRLGERVAVERAEEHIFGMVLFNDWSARDIQKWEYVPLGPFLGKSFGSSVSPWIVTLDALEAFRVDGPEQSPTPLPYLRASGKRNFDIHLEVAIAPPDRAPTVVARSNTKYLYWSVAQQLAHHTVNGCNISIGDMMASGTISGPTEDSYGSMLELSWRGTKPLRLSDGSERKFIEDHDTVTMRAWAQSDGQRVGFGEVATQLLPAKG